MRPVSVARTRFIRPLITSVLTTCAVFIPLIFLSGIAGALFYDQAIAVASGLAASLMISLTLIPTLYYLIHVKTRSKKGKKRLRSLQVFRLKNAYNRGFDFIFKYRRLALAGFVLLLLIAGGVFMLIPIQKMPPLRQMLSFRL